MRDSTNPEVSKDPRRAVLIENMVPTELDKPSAFVGIPGFAPLGAQGGASAKRTGQAVGQFTTEAGVEYTFRVIGGQGIQTLNWITSTWTTVVSVANLTTQSVTLSETARVYWLKFNNKILFSDGTNTPFTWDGQSGTAGIVKLTNCPALYGQPTMYYSKVVGIKAAERNVIVWSEEQDETIGYEQAAYNNVWALIQSSEGPLTQVIGTNEALYYIRDRSIASVSGAITKTFQTDGTRAGISETTGSFSPSGATYVNKRLFFLDTSARPHITQGPDVKPKEVWEDVAETLKSFSQAATDLAKAIAFFDERFKVACFALVEVGQTSPSAILVYNPVLDVPVAIWRGSFPIDAIAIVKNGSGTEVLMHLDNNGYSYLHGLPDQANPVLNFHTSTTTSAIRHTIEGPHCGTSLFEEKTYSRVDMALRGDGDASQVGFQCITPYGTSAQQTTEVSGGGAHLDEFVLDTDVLADVTVQVHAAFGISRTARWVRPRISHEVLDEVFGFEALSIGYLPGANTPMAK